jgi:hypothetical protein
MEKEILTGLDLCKTRWGIGEPTLMEYIRNGLPAYVRDSEHGTLEPFNGIYRWKVTKSNSSPVKERLGHWYSAPPPATTYRISVLDLCFKLSEVEEFERKHPEIERKDLVKKESAKDKEVCQKQAAGLHRVNADWRRDELAANLKAMQPGCNYDKTTLKRWISEAGLDLKAGRARKTQGKTN